jgi:hypothetical protein
MAIDRLQNWLDHYAADLGRRGLAPAEIRDHVASIRNAVTFGNGFVIERRGEFPNYRDQALVVDD